MLIEQTIEFELRWPGPPSRTCTPTAGYLYDWIIIYSKKILHEAIDLAFPHLG